MIIAKNALQKIALFDKLLWLTIIDMGLKYVNIIMGSCHNQGKPKKYL